MSNQDQTQFMENIANRLGRKMADAPPKNPYRGAPDFWKQYNLSSDERAKLLMENWEKVGGHAERFKNLDEVKSFIVNTSKELSVKQIIRNNQAELNNMNIEQLLPDCEITVWGEHDNAILKEKAAGADLGLVVADHAVSVTGSVVLQSDKNKGRTVSLLPTALMILIPMEVIRTRMGEVMEQLNLISTDEMPAGVHFVSGPSRSADIENDLTIGVHGPGVVYALIYG